ncbi:FecCD family ABC transporter permease [Kiloniella antarctica]|uniref:FecCD family ABC transporter permease n=1 Tax=Kiloniella antarctica TaxID=1550907 RepID=A0ABW5BK64_9PROT
MSSNISEQQTQNSFDTTYTRLVNKRLFCLLIAIFALFALLVTDILVGPAFLNAFDVLSALVSPQSQADPTVYVIVHSIRLPMTLMALVVGASLGIAGVQMQTILGNPLASPYTLGFSAAAGFGAAVTILIGFELPFIPGFTVPLAAFIMAGLACGLVYGFAHVRGVTAEIMILAGIATLFLFQSLQSLVQYMASPEVLQEIVFWLFGSMLKASWFSVSVSSSILILSMVILARNSWQLTALRMGDERARSIGVNVQRLRIKIFLLVSLLTAGAVAFVGTIGFIGLVAPHIARMIVGEDHRILMPLSGLVGGLLMIGASIVSKIISPGYVVPIGIVTAVIGVPFLFGLILTHKKSHW